MPAPPPPRSRNINPELTERARAWRPEAYVEILDGRAWLDVGGLRFDLGHTMRTARAELERQIDWFTKALASARDT